MPAIRPTDYVVTFHGGPADGQTRTYTRQPPLAISYLGGLYERQAPKSLDYYFQASLAPPAPKGGIAPKGHAAWSDLQRSVNHRLPTALARSRALRRAARRKLHRRFGVG